MGKIKVKVNVKNKPAGGYGAERGGKRLGA